MNCLRRVEAERLRPNTIGADVCTRSRRNGGHEEAEDLLSDTMVRSLVKRLVPT